MHHTVKILLLVYKTQKQCRVKLSGILCHSLQIHCVISCTTRWMQKYLLLLYFKFNFISYTVDDHQQEYSLVWFKAILVLAIISVLVFTALHVMQTRYSDENSVCPSVCLSVTRVNCDKTVERSVQIYITYERTFSLVFWEEEWLVGGDPFYLKFSVNRPPLERNSRFSTDNRS